MPPKSKEIPEAKIRQVIWMLDKAGKTKKACCEHLGIAYNTTRLSKIISDFKEKEIREKKFREEKKGKPLSQSDINFIINSYTEGIAQYKIANQLFISTAKVKKALLENEVPIRGRGKRSPAKVDHITQDLEVKFKKNDKVFIAHLNCYGIIDKVYDENYIESWQDGYSKAVELIPEHKLKKDQEIKLGVHYEEYWIQNGKDTGWKTRALQHHLASLTELIVETGREYYKVYKIEHDEKTNREVCLRQYTLARSKLFPVIEV